MIIESLFRDKLILIVDDEADLREIIGSELEFMGSKIIQSENIIKAQEILTTHTVDLIISDIRMPGGTGIELLDVVKAKDFYTPPVLLISGFADISAEEAYYLGAESLLTKPFDLDQLLLLVQKNLLPLKERFLINLTAPLQMQAVQDYKAILGRGGAEITVNGRGKKIDLTKKLSFDFYFDTVHYFGVGTPRWQRSMGSESNLIQVGVEFEFLENDCRKSFLRYLESSNIKSFIPSSKFYSLNQ